MSSLIKGNKRGPVERGLQVNTSINRIDLSDNELNDSNGILLLNLIKF